MSRPEYVRCIADTHRDCDGMSWCGKALSKFDLAFVSIEHAAFNGRSEGRLVACSECTSAINKAMSNGQPAHGLLSVDHASLLNKYIEHVGQCEGVDFISSIHDERMSDLLFTDEEISELKRLQQYPLIDIEMEGEK